MKILTHRLTGRSEQPFVVFLIGMRVNRWWKIGAWLRVVMAMTRMLKELLGHRELGLLSAEQWLSRTTIMVSYWSSMEQLMEFASSDKRTHLPAWKAFNKAIGTNGDVGIWHETYFVRPGDYENVYVNMPQFGMGKAVGVREADGAYARARSRLAAG